MLGNEEPGCEALPEGDRKPDSDTEIWVGPTLGETE